MKLFILLLVVLLSCSSRPADPGFPPEPCELSAKIAGDSLAVTLRWSAFPEEASFFEYVLYRGSSPDIPQNPDQATVLFTGSDIDDTLFTDTCLTWVDTVYYCLRNVNTGGSYNYSEVVCVRPLDSLDTYTCYEIQGLQTESPYKGKTVAVTGTVTCATGILDQVFTVISDAGGGPWSGLFINNPNISFDMGDSVLVIGEVYEFHSLTAIKQPMRVELIRSGCSLPPSSHVPTMELRASTVPEKWEAVLVDISDAVVLTTSYAGFQVDDGSGPCLIGHRSDISYYPCSMDTLSVTGIVVQYESDWSLEPRLDSDVQVSYQNISGHSATNWLTCAEVQGTGPDSPYDGQWVTVRAVVSAASHDYPGMTGTCYGISITFPCAFLTDRFNGPRHGLLVAWDADYSWTLDRGDNVLVTGWCSEDLYSPAEYWTGGWGPTWNTALSLSQVVHLDPVFPPPPPVIVNGGSLARESYEGVLVSVNDVVVTDKLASGKIIVSYDQGTRSCRVYSYPLPVQVGDQIQQITGIVWFNTNLEMFVLRPRDADDVIQ